MKVKIVILTRTQNGEETIINSAPYNEEAEDNMFNELLHIIHRQLSSAFEYKIRVKTISVERNTMSLIMTVEGKTTYWNIYTKEIEL